MQILFQANYPFGAARAPTELRSTRDPIGSVKRHPLFGVAGGGASRVGRRNGFKTVVHDAGNVVFGEEVLYGMCAVFFFQRGLSRRCHKRMPDRLFHTSNR